MPKYTERHWLHKLFGKSGKYILTGQNYSLNAAVVSKKNENVDFALMSFFIDFILSQGGIYCKLYLFICLQNNQKSCGEILINCS